MLPKPLRWAVHQVRCWRWLRERDRGARALSLVWNYEASRYWVEHGRRPTRGEIDARVLRFVLGQRNAGDQDA